MPDETRRTETTASAMVDPLRTLLLDAHRTGASDIHLDPVDAHHVLRHRVDGSVHEQKIVDAAHAKRLMNQVKIACRLDLERVWTPQEGRFSWEHRGAGRDVRASFVPVNRKEALHLRLLTPADAWRDLSNLGLGPDAQEDMRSLVQWPHGLALLSGLTGSGKTTTLYALAQLHDLRSRVVASVEDPVELNIPYLRQVEIDEDHGLNMHEALRALLRSDPDVLLVGEIRDHESARTVAHAALAGRLVLATIHARDAAAAIDAMHMLGVPYYVLGDSLRLVLAQDLVRRLCESCAVPRGVESPEAELFKKHGVMAPEQLKEPAGCDRCHRYGYAGRTGIFEIAAVDESLGRWIANGPHQQDIRRRFKASGIRPIAADALRKAAQGTTSLRECLRLIEASGRHTEPPDTAPRVPAGAKQPGIAP